MHGGPVAASDATFFTRSPTRCRVGATNPARLRVEASNRRGEAMRWRTTRLPCDDAKGGGSVPQSRPSRNSSRPARRQRRTGLVACYAPTPNALVLMMRPGAVRSGRRDELGRSAANGRPRRWPRGRRTPAPWRRCVRAAGIRDADSAVSFRASWAIVAASLAPVYRRTPALGGRPRRRRNPPDVSWQDSQFPALPPGDSAAVVELLRASFVAAPERTAREQAGVETILIRCKAVVADRRPLAYHSGRQPGRCGCRGEAGRLARPVCHSSRRIPA